MPIGENTPCTKTGALDSTLAETYEMDNAQGFALAREPSDQLQICPWFLDWYKGNTYKVRFMSRRKHNREASRD